MTSRLILKLMLLLLPGLAISQQNSQKNKVILAVFAHPDDESTVSPVLVKYASSGAKVYLATATDGRFGFAQHFPMKDPDSLAGIRKAELSCTAEALGIQPPIMFGLPDQLHMKDGMDSITSQLAVIRARLAELFTRLKPDVVITWGPSGLTYHPDHRAISDVVTEVFLQKRWDKPADLLYTGVPTGTFKTDMMPLATVDSSFLNVRITVTSAETAKARRGWDCHKSQYTPEVIAQLESLLWGAQKGVFYFQSYLDPQNRRNNLFPR